ncbi:DnaJ C-terminal domain-containing protein [Micromonospora mangrovi]|uniref:DnaJ C-terminal domain-containing protein n=2 Tax=Micromonospora TaxID=1873 RepID=A0AAU8HLM5_9ACTN
MTTTPSTTPSPDPDPGPDRPGVDARGVQIGDHNTQHNHFAGRTPVSWPHRVGLVPGLADQRLDRLADQDLAAALTGEQTVMVCQVLAGLGGVGKTQLAANLAHQWWQHRRVDLLLWASATSRSAVLTRYAQAAADITGVEDPNPEDAAVRLLAWLSSTDRRWLVVLDDLTDPQDLTGLWPPTTPTGRTVVTTRRRDAALLAGRRLVDVGVFDPAEAVTYLHAKLAGHPDRLDQAQELAADLGFLPLALAQAAAYLMDRGLTCGEYRKRFADRRRRLAELMPDTLPDGHQATVATTWSLSIELADAMAPAGLARPLLELASHLDPNGVPTTVFTTLAALRYLDRGLGPPPRPARFLAAWRKPPQARPRVGAADARDALHCLQRLSLISLPADASEVRVHALVQRATREQIPPDRRAVAQESATAALRQGRGTDGILRFDLTLEQAAFGHEAPITVDTAVTCDRCQGEIPAIFDCGTCAGQGRLKTRRTLTLKFPAGLQDGMRIRLANQYEAGRYGGVGGDLYVEIHELPHDRFTRTGDDLHCTLDGSGIDHAAGGVLPVVGLDGTPLRVRVPPRAHPGTRIRVRGHGVPHLRQTDPAGRGDLYLTLG